ncbi:membrane protein insertase YidC [Frigoribacterium sp. 2-23]|uniref:membrane protein insertase YidC n=1 Tax=Frigoribacterium sp. 2-23 TaxID=3415006 RepID=UPI003C6EF439
MDLSLFPPFAVVLDGLSRFVSALGSAVEPLAGASAAALAVVLLTVLVRLVLVPVGVSQVRAEFARRRLAPKIADLRRRITDKEKLNKAMLELYTSEKVSPLAGCLPLLAQAPVVSAVYSLFVHASIAGHANVLLTQTFAGVALGSNLFVAAGAGVPALLPFVVLLAVLAVVVELTRRAGVRAAGAASTEAATAAVPGMAVLTRWLPFISVLFAAIAPLAAALYLVTSAVWTLGERAVLRRVLAPRV